MIRKIRSSLWLKIFLLLMVAFFSASFLLYGILEISVPKGYEEAANNKLAEDVFTLRQELEQCTLEDVSNLIDPFCAQNNAFVVLEHGDIRESFGNAEMQNKPESDTDISLISTTTSFEQKLLGDYNIYTLTISVTRQTQYYIVQTFDKIFPVICCVIIAISAFMAGLISHFLASPIIKISKMSNQMTALDLTGRCNLNRIDEVGILATNLDTMAYRLDSALKELTVANEKLQEDIQKEHLQEKMRMDFFRVVSHELKTPLTILKGEMEGMIYQVGEYKDRDLHLRKSMRTVEEMELLVKEIISASRMAGNDFVLTVEDVEVSQLVLECCRKWQGVAEDKGQNFYMDISKNIFCRGDIELLRKAISNIIGNAVIHSPNLADITVSLKDNVLQIQNSGVTIPASDLEHLFKPFYRVEDSRNRETGGTGLGLYIVKSILERHKFSASINNTENGVCFTIVLL